MCALFSGAASLFHGVPIFRTHLTLKVMELKHIYILTVNILERTVNTISYNNMLELKKRLYGKKYNFLSEDCYSIFRKTGNK